MATSVPDLIEEMTNQANEHGCMSLKMISGILQKYGVILESKESELISRKYLSPNGSIQALRLLKVLDIGIPSDYLEIDKFQDPLPQPYRMISKVLELEIIDRAWLEILRKYPEVQEQIPGRNTILRRNKNLDIESFPSNQSERSRNVTAMAGCEGFSLTVNDQGAFSVLELETGKFLHTLQIFPDDPIPPEHLQYKITSPSSTLPPLTACRVAVLKIKILPKPPPEPEPEESEKDKKAKAAAAAAAAKKVAPPAKGKGPMTPAAETEEKKSPPTHRCSVALIDLLSIHSSSTMQCNLVYSFDCNLLSGQVHSEFSSDGRGLLISHGPEIAFFKFPPVDSAAELFSQQRMGKIVETDGDTLEEGGGDSMKSPSSSARVAEMKTMEPQSRWAVMEEVLRQVTAIEKAQMGPLRSIPLSSEGDHSATLAPLPQVQSCHFFSFGSAFDWEDQPNTAVLALQQAHPHASGNKATSFRSNSCLYHNGLAVFLEDIQRWFIFGLRTVPPPPPPPAPISPRADAKKDKAAAAAAVVAPPEPLPEDTSKRLWVLDLLRHFPLSSAVSTVEFDSKRSVLILGQWDGSVSLWDLRGLMLISLSTKHRSAVTSLCLTQGVSSYFLVSGDADGVLCFHKIHVAASLSGDLSLPSLSSVSSSDFSASTQPILSAELIDFRLDFTRESIVRIWSLHGSGVSVVVVQISSGRLVAYDADGAELLGRLSLTSGVLGLRMEYSLALTQDCIIANPTPTPAPSATDAASSSSSTDIPPATSPAAVVVSAAEERSRSQLWRDRVAIATGCSNGFCAFFFRCNLKAVVSSFNVAKFLTFFYPGIASLSKTSASVNGRVLSPLALYKLLKPAQRMDPKLKSSQVAMLNEPPPTETKSQGKISRTSSRPNTFGSTGSSSNILTTAKLKELEKSYQVLDSSSPASLLPALADFSSSRITSPKIEFERSARASQNERINRKKQVVNSLKHLSALL